MGKKREVDKIKKDGFFCSLKELSVLLGVNHVSVCSYVKNGMPKAAVGVYDVKECLDWWLENIYKGKAEEKDDTINEHKRKYWKEKAAEIFLKNEQLRGRLIDNASVESGISELISKLRSSLLSWPARLFPNDDALREKMRHEVHSYLSTIKSNEIIVAKKEKEPKKKSKRTPKKAAKK